MSDEFDGVPDAAVHAACSVLGRHNASWQYQVAEMLRAAAPALQERWAAPVLAIHIPCHEPDTDPAMCRWAGNAHGTQQIDTAPRCTVCVDDDVYAVAYPCPTALAARDTTTTREETP